MATYLFRSTQPHDRNSNGINAVLVSAATEGLARQLLAEVAPAGTQVPESWPGVQIAATELPPAMIPTGQRPIVLIEGNAVLPGELTRGGNRYDVPL